MNGNCVVRVARIVPVLAACALLSATAAAQEVRNLAPDAEVTANSEYSADFLARWAVDGKIPA